MGNIKEDVEGASVLIAISFCFVWFGFVVFFSLGGREEGEREGGEDWRRLWKMSRRRQRWEAEQEAEKEEQRGGKASRLCSVWSCASCQPVHDR